MAGSGEHVQPSMQFSHDISVQRVPHTKVQTESTQSFIQDVIWGGEGGEI